MRSEAVLGCNVEPKMAKNTRNTSALRSRTHSMADFYRNAEKRAGRGIIEKTAIFIKKQHISYYFLELARFRKKEWEKLTGQPERWCYIFKKLRTFADGTPIPADLHGFEDVVGDAKLDGLSIDKQKDYAEAMLEDYIRYTETLAAREEGITEGETRGRAEVARNMLAMGMNADVITKATGLSAEEVQALAAK